MLALIRGAGDIASGAAMRLWRCGIDVVMTDLARPTAIRRTVAFSNAIVHGETTVEGLRAVRAENAAEAKKLLREGSVDPNLYAAVETVMEMSADYIHSVRAEWIDRLTGIFDRYYSSIAGTGEHVSLSYDSGLNRPDTTLQTLMDEARRHDEIVKHTSVGIHRDDIGMDLDGMSMRRTGSQGQCKTFTIALRLAQYDFLHQSTGMRPLLLLDDIFDKLDATRVERIMELVTSDSFGQIFITDTNRTHLDEIMRRTGGDYRMWSVENGIFTPTES